MRTRARARLCALLLRMAKAAHSRFDALASHVPDGLTAKQASHRAGVDVRLNGNRP
jgi:hypothetical protein